LRFYVWDVARQAILNHPLLGVGPGNFSIFFQSHRTSLFADQNGVFDDAHNLFLQLLASNGIPFGILFVILLVVSIVFGFKKIKKDRDPTTVALVVSLISWCLMASFTPVPSANFLLLAVIVAG